MSELNDGFVHADLCLCPKCKPENYPDPAVGELLPDCMMPDGADPCIGYQQLYERFKQSRARIEQLEAGLNEIAKGEGEFSRFPLIHATNTIESMKAIARALLKDR